MDACDLLPLDHVEVEALRREWASLPATDPRRRLLATLDASRAAHRVTSRVLHELEDERR